VAARCRFSAPTLSVLAALCSQPTEWRHGYALAKLAGLTSGTLYPTLIRLAGQGLIEACWQDEAQPEWPRRHLYKLSADGLAAAARAGVAEPAEEPEQRAPLAERGAAMRAVP